MKRLFFSKMFRNNEKGLTHNPSTRVLKVEDLESRVLLSATQGISEADFNSIKSQYAGFDYSSITSSKVYVVDVATDSTSASLRDAIARAKTSSGADMIVVKTTDTANTIKFTSASDSITISDSSSLIIIAYGSKNLTINADGKSRIFEITGAGKTQIANMSLTAGAGENGGAINNSGKMILDRMNIYCNSASQKGGGIYSSNEIEIVNSIISDNTSANNGGGIYIDKAAFNGTILKNYITNSTIVNNTAGNDGNSKGGGIFFDGRNPDYLTPGAQVVFSSLQICNSIIVENNADSKIDENIYDINFYTEAEVKLEDGTTEIRVVEQGVPVLPDSRNNLSTFTFWADDNDSQKKNFDYNSAINLFTDASVRDYSLTRPGINEIESQAIDKGNNDLAAYRNGTAITFDLNGNLRKINDKVDLGACECPIPYIDLATANSGQLVSETSVVNGELSSINGQKLRIKKIAITNNDELFASEKFTIHFYLSEDSTITNDDILAGTIAVDPIANKSTCYVDSGILNTDGITPGKSYYVGWMIEAFSDGEKIETLKDNNLENNTAYCTTRIKVLNDAASVETVSILKESESIQQGCGLYLAVDTNKFDGSNVTYWWDYGNGYFVKGEKASYISSDQLTCKAGNHCVRVKIVDNNTKTVIASGSFEKLEVSEVNPVITVRQTSFLSNRLLKLEVNATYYDRYAQSWSINWGDNTTPSTCGVANSMTAIHYYSGTKACNVTLTLIDSNGNGGDIVYNIAVYDPSKSVSASQAIDDFSASALSDVENEKNQAGELRVSESAALIESIPVAAPKWNISLANALNPVERIENSLSNQWLILSDSENSSKENNTKLELEPQLNYNDLPSALINEKEEKKSIFENDFSPEDSESDYFDVAVLSSSLLNQQDEEDLFDFLNEDEF